VEAFREPAEGKFISGGRRPGCRYHQREGAKPVRTLVDDEVARCDYGSRFIYNCDIDPTAECRLESMVISLEEVLS
jgi:hypothetical protein